MPSRGGFNDVASDEEDELLFEDEEEDEEGFDSVAGSRAVSPSKLTARQRAKNNKDLQDTLIALPSGTFVALSWHITNPES